MKTILITVGETTVSRNLLRTEFLENVLTSGARVVLVTDPELKSTLETEFGGERVIVEALPVIPVSFFERVIAFFARNCFVTGTNVLMQHRAYESGETKIPSWFKQLLGLTLGKLPGFRGFMRLLEMTVSSHRSVITLFDTYTPDLVFSTVLLNTEIDIPVMRETKRRKIRSIGMVRGWDNLTTYGFLRIVPDTYFAQVDFLKESAISFHGIPSSRIEVVGMTYFDVYEKKELYVSREEYCAAMGIDPAKNIILYAAIGDFLFPREGEMADVFEKMIEDGSIPNAVCIFRAHPAFSSPLERMKGMKHVIPDRNADYQVGGLARWDMKVAHTAHLINSIRHAAVLVTAGSTMMIESALLDRPTISVAFDGNTKERYWFSIARFHYQAAHIVNLLKTKGVKVPDTKEELKEMINRYIADPKLDTDGRLALAERFGGPHRGRAALHLADRVLAHLS